MKVFKHVTVCKLSLLTIFFLAVACHKGYISPDGISDEVYTVRFEIKDFEPTIRPIGHKAAVQRNHFNNTIASVGDDMSVELYEGYLYYWSFNAESLTPDIAIQSGSSIRYNGGQVPGSFVAGWAYDGFSAGRALNQTGVQELTICFPVERAVSLSTFDFDIGSPGTGPKAFDLYYSIDGDDWIVYQLDNQFTDVTTNGATKNTFTFEDIDNISVEDLDFLWFRIIPKEGDRKDLGGNYNPTGGAARFDNIRLSGTALPSENAEIDQLHYYVFDANTGDLVLDDEVEFDLADPTVSLEVPYGNYQVSFVRNNSNTDLLWPGIPPNRSDYWFSNFFSNSLAAVFADEIELFVNEDKQESITLNRYYSQVRFEFTDSRDLSLVKRLVITPLHEPFFYAPYNSTMSNPVTDQSEIDVEPDFSLSKEFVFNQFMGKASAPEPISYRVEVYDEHDELLRAFDVSASIRNNVQLVFRGELLDEVAFGAEFQMQINEDWDGELEVGF